MIETNTYYEILSKKPHNEMYLNRYVKYISSLQNKKQEGVLEKHHICPKANDMFPQFKCFNENPWNMIKLTPRQHYIAHLLLWKSFSSIRSTSQALHYMSHGKWKHCVKYSVLYEKLILDWKEKRIKTSKKSNKERLDSGTHHLLTSIPCVDIHGNVKMILKEDFYKRKEINCLEYVAISSKEGRFRKRGEYNRRNKNTIPCIDKDGNFIQIDEKLYINQIGDKSEWDYAHISSNEGIKRKNKDVFDSRLNKANLLTNRPEVNKIKEIQNRIKVRLSQGWHQKKTSDLNDIIEKLNKIELLLSKGISHKEIEKINFDLKFSFDPKLKIRSSL